MTDLLDYDYMTVEQMGVIKVCMQCSNVLIYIYSPVSEAYLPHMYPTGVADKHLTTALPLRLFLTLV